MNAFLKKKIKEKISSIEIKHNIKQVAKGNPRPIVEKIRGNSSTVSAYGRLQAQDKRVLYSGTIRNRYLREICSGSCKQLNRSAFDDLFLGLVDYTYDEINYFSNAALAEINLSSNSFNKNIMENIIKSNPSIFTDSKMLKTTLKKSNLFVRAKLSTQAELNNFKKEVLSKAAIRLANTINSRFPDLASSLRDKKASSTKRLESIVLIYGLITETMSSDLESKKSREAWVNQYLLYKLVQQPKGQELWLVTIIKLTSNPMDVIDEVFSEHFSHEY